MKKTLTLILSFAFILGSFSMIAAPALMQPESSVLAVDDWDDWNTWDDDWWDTDTTTTTTTTYGTDFEGVDELAALFGGFVLVFVFGTLGFTYIYTSITLMAMAKRLDYDNAWFAWIPILNLVLLLKMGDMNPLLVLLILIPGLGGLAIAIINVIALMNISEKIGYEKLLALLILVPIANFVLLGMLAWGKKDKAPQVQSA